MSLTTCLFCLTQCFLFLFPHIWLLCQSQHLESCSEILGSGTILKWRRAWTMPAKGIFRYAVGKGFRHQSRSADECQCSSIFGFEDAQKTGVVSSQDPDLSSIWRKSSLASLFPHSYMLCPPLREVTALWGRICWGFPSQKGKWRNRFPLPHASHVPHGSGALLGLLLLLQTRGKSLNPFSKQQQLNLTQVCHFSAKRPASHLLKGWTDSCWFGLISSRVWKHCQASVSPPAVSSTCCRHHP